MAEPLDNDQVSFALNFINDGAGRFTVDEPIGSDGLNFVLEQDSGRYGRDVSFAGGEFNIRFDEKSNQNESQLRRLLDYDEIYGSESQVQFIVVVNDTDYVVGLLDFQSAITDGLSYFETTVIQESRQALLKRRSDIKIDMFATTDLDGNTIEALTTQNVFLPAKNILSESRWFAPTQETFNIPAGGNTLTWNYINAIQQSDIDNTLTYFAQAAQADSFRYFEAQANLTDVELVINDLNYTETNITQSLLLYRIGTVFASATEVELNDFGTNNVVDYDATFSLPDIEQGENLWIYFSASSVAAASITAQENTTIRITANTTPISTVVPAFDIQDIIGHVVSATSGLSAVFSAAFNTAALNQYCFNGLQLRGFNPDNVYISFDEIVNWMQEINADYQIQDNNAVFFGLYADFYANNEAGAFLTAPPTSLRRNYNRLYTVNKFNFNYDSFEDDKNTDNNNALSAIHTETQWSLPNTQVEDKREIDIDFIRDAALIESTRRFNTQSDNENSTQNDEDIFIIDTVPGLSSVTNEYNFSSSVQVSGNVATFLNNNNFSFLATGLIVGSVVTFTADTFTAAGNVTEISATSISIFDGGVSGIVSGQYLVNFSFTVTALVARTDEGFGSITNDGANGEGFANILYSPKRNILNYWGAWLNTACSFTQTGTIRNTFFVNNPNLTSDFTSDPYGSLREGDNIVVSDLNTRILSPYIYETSIYIDFEEFQTIISNLRANRGFLRIADNNERVIMIHPQSLSYDVENNALEVIGEQRFESDVIAITTQDGFIFINEAGYDTDLIDRISWLFDGDFVYLYDNEGVLLTNRKRFDFISVNGSTFNEPEDLAEALENLNP